MIELKLSGSGAVSRSFRGTEVLSGSGRADGQLAYMQVAYDDNAQTDPYVVELESAIASRTGSVEYTWVRDFTLTDDGSPVPMQLGVNVLYRFRYGVVDGLHNNNDILVRVTG